MSAAPFPYWAPGAVREAERVQRRIDYRNHVNACPGCGSCVMYWPKYRAIVDEENRRRWRLRFMPHEWGQS